jgi:adenylyltransferase/sulfurtransferase
MPVIPECKEQSCLREGVLGISVAVIASLQCTEAIKILTGNSEKSSPYLTKCDIWNNEFQRIDISKLLKTDCPCCGRNDFEFLEK